MKRLDFHGDGSKEKYDVLYDGLTGTSRGFEAPGETRVIGKVLDKMESIGVPATRNGATFSLRDSGGIVDLEDAEYDLMADCLKKVQWRAIAVRAATKAMDWFNSATQPAEGE